MEPTLQRTKEMTEYDEALQLLLEIESSIVRSQSAVLGRRLSEIDTCTAEQRILCGKLQTLATASEYPGMARLDHPHLISAATRLREKARIFWAVLAKTRRNLDSLQHALLGLSRFYQHTPSRDEERTL
jgi:hypothetical protein